MNGINRTGNMFVPNNNYCDFEEFLAPIIRSIAKRTKESGEVYTPSKLIRMMARKIDNKESIYHWCYLNNIPVFCPGITDGSVGDVLFFSSYKYPNLSLDVMRDHFELNDLI